KDPESVVPRALETATPRGQPETGWIPAAGRQIRKGDCELLSQTPAGTYEHQEQTTVTAAPHHHRGACARRAVRGVRADLHRGAVVPAARPCRCLRDGVRDPGRAV